MKSVLGDYMKSVIWWGEINLFWGGNGNLAGEGEGHYWKGGGGVPPPLLSRGKELPCTRSKKLTT